MTWVGRLPTALKALLRVMLPLVIATAAVMPAYAGVYNSTNNGDTWVNEGSVNQNNGTVTTLRATTNGSNAARTRAMIRFTLPAIPANEQITQAILQLRVTTATTRVVSVHRITAGWTETGATWGNASGLYDGSVLASFTPSTNNSFVSIDVTSLVRAWADGSQANHGIMLLGATSSAAQFASEENGTVANRPRLTITTALRPAFMVVKSSSVSSDPQNGSSNPKAIPGAAMLYTIGVSNSSAGAADANSTVFTDAVPPGMAMYVRDFGAIGSGPVAFANGPVSSGLSYSFAGLSSTTDSLSFSNNGGGSFNYVPTANASGFDPAVTHVRISLAGSFAAKTGATDPSLSLRMVMIVE